MFLCHFFLSIIFFDTLTTADDDDADDADDADADADADAADDADDADGVTHLFCITAWQLKREGKEAPPNPQKIPQRKKFTNRRRRGERRR